MRLQAIEFKTLYAQIVCVLRNSIGTRDSDSDLRWELWSRFYSEFIHRDGLRRFVYQDDEKNLPNQDDIKRIRAKIQNDEKRFLPTSWKVAKQRKWLETEWRSLLGYSVPVQVDGKLSADRFKKTVKRTAKLL